MLTEQQKHKFETMRQMAKEELEQLDREISAELAKVKDRLLELQQAKKAV
jgi:ABC-type Zn uptake system ZnuABC Zn-binding protein ZnuA